MYDNACFTSTETCNRSTWFGRESTLSCSDSRSVVRSSTYIVWQKQHQLQCEAGRLNEYLRSKTWRELKKWIELHMGTVTSNLVKTSQLHIRELFRPSTSVSFFYWKGTDDVVVRQVTLIIEGNFGWQYSILRDNLSMCRPTVCNYTFLVDILSSRR